jgi:hypothetical protein
VEKVFRNISGLPYDLPIPFEVANIGHLEKLLVDLITMKIEDPHQFKQKQDSNRNFMKMYWNPIKMVSYFETLYDLYLNENSNPYAGLRYSSDLQRVRENRNLSAAGYRRNKVQVAKELKLDSLKFIGEGKEALLLALGPSAGTIDLNKYSKCDIFSCNFYYKKFGIDIVKYWFCIDSVAFRQAISEINKDAVVFANYPIKNVIPFVNNRVWLCDNEKLLNKYFNSNIEFERPLTVATVMLAMAIYMQYNPIYITGVDLSLEKSHNNYCYKDVFYNAKFRDFHSNYKWIIKEFKKLKHEADVRGIKIIDLNERRDKNLKVF